MYYYSIRHLTNFFYSESISESVMELRMQPLSRDSQRCLNFDLRLSPKVKVHAYQDYLGNMVHHFNIPSRHNKLSIAAESHVSLLEQNPIPPALSSLAWDILESKAIEPEFFEMLQPSFFAHSTQALQDLQAELGIGRGDDPLSTLHSLNEAVYNTFEYQTGITEVDSPIDHALQTRKGVCQDFVHVMIALVRELGIPCRYVSGYLFHRTEESDRSLEDATHAWLEAWLPELGWVGFDPTNNLVCLHRHIRVAIGRDYADVPPTRGVFKGDAESHLEVAVAVTQAEKPPIDEELKPVLVLPENTYTYQQQQQQQ